MAKTTPDTTPTTPAKPAPNGKVRNAFGAEIDPDVDAIRGRLASDPVETPVKPISQSELDKLFPRDEDGKPFDADRSTSPDDENSHMAGSQSDDKPVEPVLTGEPPHWSDDERQRKLFDELVKGLIDDYGLFDRDDHGALREWYVMSFIDHHGILPKDYATFGDVRKAVADKALEDFKADLRDIAKKKGFPIVMRGDLHKLIGYYTVEDALQKMTGKGIRTAICGKLEAMVSEQHVAAANVAMQRNLDEQKAAAQTTDAPAKPEPQYVPLEEDAQPKSPKTTEQRSLTVQRNRVPSAPPEHSLSVNWQMNPLQIAQFAVQSGLYKGIDSEAKAMMVMLRGLSLQIDPLMALEQINIIEGKTAVSSALMHALVERSGQLEDIKIVETDLQCTVTLTRTGRTPVSVTYSNEDAIRAGLVNKYNWKTMPKLMRYHRAFAIASRRCFSDVLLFGGAIYTNEELQPDRNVNEDGDFVTVTTAA